MHPAPLLIMFLRPLVVFFLSSNWFSTFRVSTAPRPLVQLSFSPQFSFDSCSFSRQGANSRVTCESARPWRRSVATCGSVNKSALYAFRSSGTRSTGSEDWRRILTSHSVSLLAVVPEKESTGRGRCYGLVHPMFFQLADIGCTESKQGSVLPFAGRD